MCPMAIVDIADKKESSSNEFIQLLKYIHPLRSIFLYRFHPELTERDLKLKDYARYNFNSSI